MSNIEVPEPERRGSKGRTTVSFAGRVRGMAPHRKVLAHYERTIHCRVKRRLIAAGYDKQRAFDRAMAYIRAKRTVQLGDAMTADLLLKHARALELADRTIEAIEREAGMDKKLPPSPTGSGLKLRRAPVQAASVEDEPRACEADAVEDESREAPETASNNAGGEVADRAET